ncbi:S9 family peptidase [Gilvimarinus agarilyticus]|uniref:S9 family peptidase n=1 Tax=Reichenbachiella agariperforans TaxID=156994 RepID=UPI001C09F537|nr:S9 family peptidase [Reichenbachiella agariperforans]MBU2884762.1 S9 family peptidase [Gilvimarinus agarilyticus]MBU2914916.1 S9 family peptidase [Reichenbachiella agariperforans]
MKQLLTMLLLMLGVTALAQKKIAVEDFTEKGTFRQDYLSSLTWMNNGLYYSALEDNQILRYNVTTGASDSILVDGDALHIRISDYEFSNDETKILLLTEQEYIYRRSYTAEYYVYTFEGEQMSKLSDGGRQSYATFSPDNSMVAFVRENNLYYVKLVNMSEHAVTTDGEFGSIINGSTDWVYEEELYLTKAFNWSPDSKKISFFRFDESQVKEYNLQYWDNGAIYPRDYRYKYPKAGQDNAVVEVFIHNLPTNRNVKVKTGEETDVYYPKMQWTQDANTLSLMKLNRLQNRLDIYHVNAKTGGMVLILTDKSKTYLDVTYAHELIYLDNGTQFLYSTEREGYKHYHLHRIDGQLNNLVTKGNWEAEEFVGLDQSGRTPVLYYISTEGSSMERHFYKVDLKGKGKTKLSTKAGINSVDMSKDFKYYISFNHSANSPREISLMSTKKNELVKVLKDSKKLKETAEQYGLSQKVFFDIDGADSYQLNAYMLQPIDMDSTKQYPVLIYQYSGPGSQNVTNGWSGGHYYFHQMLVQKGYIVVCVDTRGTGGRGEKFKKMTYMNLGKMEVQDLVASAKFLGKMSFVDADRIGVWGWSYGGHMSSLSMMTGDGVFKAGIAVAPVTNWRFYDTIYTERYMRTPQENPEGYDSNSPNTYANQLKGNFLLIHGTGDDNVHFQNAVTLQESLIQANKQFDSFYYPDKAHSLYGGKTRTHLYTMMTNWIMDNL